MAFDRCKMVLLASAATTALLVSSDGMAQSARSTEAQLRELKQLIEQQQRVIEQLQGKVEAMEADVTEASKVANENRETIEQARTIIPDKPIVASTEPRVRLGISGQINRMVNLIDDGDSTKGYFVDNNLSVSRVRFQGEGKYSDDLTIGSTIEVGIAPNNSNDVSQFNESPSDNVSFRKVEGVFKSKSLGTVYFGKGDASAKDIARIDLSNTDVIAYANVADVAGGMFFVDDDNVSTGIQVKNAFTDFDPSRQNRVRYDTPSFYGLTLSGTAAEDQKYNASLRWGGEGYGLKTAAGIGIQDPSQQDVSNVITGSASGLHLGTGLSLTGAAGVKNQDGSNPVFYYAKAGWQHEFFEAGDTAFSIDWQRTENNTGNEDTANSFGFAVVQRLEGYGTEFYGSLRSYALDLNDASDPNDLIVGTVGTRVKF